MIPQPLPLAFPVLAAYLAAWLKDARLKPWQNYAIVTVLFVLAVVLSIFVSGGLTGDPGRDIGLIIAECAAVFAALKPLTDQASTAIPSPLGAMAAQHQRHAELQREVEAMWTAARASVPQRASAAGVIEGTGKAMSSQSGIDTTPTPVVPPQPPTQP